MIFNHGGGGASLNFKGLAYATEAALLAATPAEYAIGVVTTNKITAWVFSAAQPQSLLEGAVWILTGTDSVAAFNALKDGKKAIILYPMSAKQYVGGELVDVVAKSYIGGQWVDWSLILVPSDNLPDQVTSGGNGATIDYQDGVLTATLTNTSYAYLEADVTEYKTLKIVGHKSKATANLLVGILDESNNLVAGSTLDYTEQDISVTCDIGALSGTYRIGVKTVLKSEYLQTTVVTLTSMILE